MNGGTIINIPAVLPPCATAPAVVPCVQERTYTLSVNLPPSPGGMHLVYSLCCRNPSILNITAPAAAGETFYAFIPCYFSKWTEDFTLPNGTTTDVGPTAWTRTLGVTPPVSAQVNNGQFEILGSNNGSMIWASQIINIAAYPLGVNLSANLSRFGANYTNNDTLKLYYSINSGPKVLWPVNGLNVNAWATPRFATANALVGNTIQLYLHARFNAAATSVGKTFDADMITVYDNTFVPNSSPAYSALPPLFVCSTNTFSLNQSATDLDGDVLVYSMYTPYNDAPAPTYPNNVASMTPITWVPSYTATSPFNSPSPTVTLNAGTGIMTGVANTNGQFVFGVKCQEYRGGVLLSEMVRDYQMNTVTCPPFVPPPPVAGSNSPLCVGQTLNLTASTVAGATYSWTGPGGFTSALQNPSIVGVTLANAGTYSVQAIVAGCTGIAGTVAVVVNPTPAAPTASVNTPLCVGATANFTASTIAAATYSWTGPSAFTSAIQNPSIAGITVANAGTYSVNVTVGGCKSPNGTVTLVVNPLPAAPTATANTPLCVGQTLNLGASTIAGATYSWSGPSAFSSALQNPSIVGITLAGAGTYSVNASVLGCKGPNGTVAVVVNPLPVAPAAGSNSPLCVGQTLNLTASAIAGATYSWSGPSAFSSALQNPSIAGITLAGAGTYSVNATVLGCAGPSGTVAVVVNPLPVAPTAGSNSPLCVGATLNLTASAIAGATYNWSGPSAFSSALQNPTIAGITLAGAGVYSVNATVLGCAGPSGTVNVVVNPLPAAPVAGSNSPLCVGQTLNLTASAIAGATYTWNGPAAFTSALQNPSLAAITLAGAGVYSVSANVLGCAGPLGTVNVVVNPLPAAPTAGSNSPLCVGQTLNLTASAIAGATYSWTGPGAFSSALQNPSIAGISLAGAGTYSVYVSVLGCSGPSGTVAVVVNPLPAAPTAGSNSPLCVVATLNLTASAIAGASYNWTGPGAFASALQNPSIAGITLAGAGVYSVSATVLGCAGPAGTVNVVVNPLPAAPTAGSNSPLCVGQTLNLTASAIAGATYNWSGPGAFSSALQNPTLAGITLAGAGVYSVNATVLGCPGPSGTVNVVVNPLPAAPVAGSNSPLCVGQTLNLIASAIAGATYNWSGPNTFSSALQNPTLAGITLAGAGVYSVNATVLGCAGPSGTVNVVVNPLPAAPTAGSNAPICEGQTLNLTASNIGGATYNWTGPNTFTSTTQNPSIPATTTLAAGIYSVSATVLGCAGPAGTVNVVINSTPPAPTAGANTPLCAGQTLSLTAGTIAGVTYSWTGPNSFTSTVQNPTIAGASTLAAGVYSVNATSAAGCVGPVGTVSVIVNAGPLPVVAGSNSPLCIGATLSLTASTISGATYLWSGPLSYTSAVQNPTIGGITLAQSGTYTVNVTVLGCSGSFGTVNVVVAPPVPAPAAGSNSPLCEGQPLLLTAGTIAGATYSWIGPNSFTSTVQNPTVVATTTASAGTYSVTANVAGCTSPSGTVAVIVNPTPAAPTAGSNSPLCEGATLNLTANNIAGATYNWVGPNSFTSTTQNPSIVATTSLAAGTYSVNVTVGGCAGPFGLVAVTVNPLPAPVIAGSNAPLCIGATLSLTASNIVGAVYNWNGPLSFTSAVQNPTIGAITLTGAGVYSVNVTVAGCTGSSGTVNVVVAPPVPAPAAGSNAPICEGQPLLLTAGTIASATYSWTGPNTYTAAIQNPTLVTTTTLSAGIYSVTANVGGCTSPAGTVAVIVNPSPAAPITTANSPICAGQTLSLTAGTIAGATYSWTGPNTFTSNIQNPTIVSTTTLASGVYSVNATVAGCPGPYGTVTVSVNPIPGAPTAGSNSPLCVGSTLSLTASSIAGATYSWTGPNTFTSTTQNPTIVSTTSVATGVYSVNVSVLGCTGPNGTVSVLVTDPAVVNAGPTDTICSSALVITLSGTATAGYTYNWTTAGTGTFGNPILLGTTYTMSATDTLGTNITFTLTATGGGCPGTSSTVTYLILKGPIANAGPDLNVCKNALIPLNGLITGVTTTGMWSSTGTGTFNPNNTTLNGIYAPSSGDTASVSIQLILTSTNNKGCVPSRDTLKVNFLNAPRASFTYSTACANQPVSFNNTSTPAASITSYTWNFGDGGTSSATNPTNTYTVGGTYTVNLIAVNVAGCPDTAKVAVPVFIAPVADFTYSNVCVGAVGVFKDLTTVSSGTVTSWAWTFGDGGTSSIQNPYYTYSVAGTYSVNLTVLSSNGCPGTITKPIIVNPKPKADFSISANPIFADESVTFTDLSTPTGSISTWNWNYGDGNGSTSQNPSYIYDDKGNFIVQLAIMDNGGCVDTVRKEIIVVLLPKVPTAFTPNGDGHNDMLFVKGGPFKTMYFRTYNSWGEILFETTEQDKGWDGTYKGQKVPLGVYVWILDVDMFNGDHIRKTGDITILK